MEILMARYDAKTSQKGQATIPAEIRELIGLQPGGTVQFVAKAGGEVQLIAKGKGLRALKGLFAHGGPPIDIDEAIMDAVAARNDLDRTESDL
jgi:AbrB family looped-hinge helix DNA binding protein